ncbi:proliferating cell nuclear antigen (pcna) [Candidatus Woesearchaeota archaeon]|nr:proliferating cell nuclear antigen (pcna) [Candidatus Woesearchaeota archaeon]
MKLSLAEPKYLKESISIISELVNEARIKVTGSAIELVAMDPANVAMVIFKLLSSSFVEYKVEKDQEIAINLSNLKQILRRAKPNDVLSLEVVENKLKVTLKSGTVRTFSLPIIDIEEREQKIPSLTFPVDIQMPSSVLLEAVEDADIVAESVSFVAEPKKLVIDAEGDLSKAQIEIRDNNHTRITVEGGSEVRSKYSIEYLKKMIQGAKLAENVSIRFNKDYPLKIDFTEVDKVSLSFILAPRVDND